MDLKYIALVLKEYADEINNNEFDNLYENFQMESNILTSYLLKAGIDPLQTLGWVPENYARDLLSVTEAHINDDVTFVGNNAFFKCNSLKSVYLPASIETISSFAFAFCFNLKEVHYDGTIEELKQVNLGKHSFEDNVVFICHDGRIQYTYLVD